MKKKLSIVDIANHLNVSKTTVSFVLNGRAKEKRISEDLVARVLKFVEEVGYKPNSLAKSLRTGKSHTIGLMVEDISNPFFARIARRIEDKAYNNGYKIIYSSTDNDTAKTKELIDMFSDRHVDGYIIAPPVGIEENVSNLIKQNLPVVFFDRYLPEIETDYVVINNEFSTYNATRHLVDRGYKNIAFITFQSQQTQMQDRVKGYQKALQEHQLNEYLKEIKFNQNEELIVKPIHEFLTANKQLDAILFGTNHMGACGLRVINELGLKIPTDLAIASFDDYEVFQLYSPPITAIEQPVEEIADKIISLMLKRLKGKVNEKEHITVQTTLVVRNSSAANL